MILNVTKATEPFNGTPGTSYSQNYTDGTTYSSGDVVEVYITQSGATTAKLPFLTTVIAASSGWTAIANQQADTTYAFYAVDGSGVTKFTADYIDDEIDVSTASNFTGQELYAWTVYIQTTTQGIQDFFGAVVAQDDANIQFATSVNLNLDNTTTTNLYQTDNIRIYREDGARPVKNPTTGGGGIDVNWREKVFIAETGVSGLTGTESTQLFGTSLEATLTTLIGTPVTDVSTDIAAVKTDTTDLQTNQGDWATATGFSTASDVTTSTTTIQADIAAQDSDTKVVEGTITQTQALRAVLATASGDIADDGISAGTVKSTDGLKDRATFTYDADGNRVISARDLT